MLAVAQDDGVASEACLASRRRNESADIEMPVRVQSSIDSSPAYTSGECFSVFSV